MELSDRRGINVQIVCTYHLIVGMMVNNFVKYLLHKYIFFTLLPKVFCYGIGG